MTRHIARLSLAGLIVAGSSGALGAQSSPTAAKATVVLVHGAFADGTGWQQGPVILVGHSYGGAVITEAAAGSSNVKALVYIAAFAPEAGEAIGAFGEKYPAPLGAALKAINPDLERFYAKRMGAKTVEVSSSHAVFLSHPNDVARLTEQAASATAK